MNDEPSYRDIVRAQRRAVAVKIGVVGLVLLLVLAGTVHRPLLGHLQGWLHGDHDLLGRSSWSPPDLRVGPGTAAGLDLQRVHAELIPGWFIALANSHADGARVQARYRDLLNGLSADPQLSALAVAMHTMVVEDPWENGDRLLATCAAWNQHMAVLAQPWHLECNVVDTGSGPFFYAKSYRVEAELEVPITGRFAPLKVLRRADETNVREGYLGVVMVGQERALVILDRVRERAVDALWPLLDPRLDPELSSRELAYAPHLRASIEAGLVADQVESLRATAGARAALEQVVAAVEARRACGASLRLYRIPWHGLDQDELDQLEDLARAQGKAPCPGITLDEVDSLRVATAALRDTEGLEPALEALVAWAARGTAVHELRHVADTWDHGHGRVPCEGGDVLSTGAVREASAYLASLAHSDARYAALYIACEQVGGSHARAMAWVSEGLDGACELPGDHLGARAAALEAAAFGDRGPVILPAEWPAALPVR
jgi:hypothetical protein